MPLEYGSATRSVFGWPRISTCKGMLHPLHHDQSCCQMCNCTKPIPHCYSFFTNISCGMGEAWVGLGWSGCGGAPGMEAGKRYGCTMESVRS